MISPHFYIYMTQLLNSSKSEKMTNLVDRNKCLKFVTFYKMILIINISNYLLIHSLSLIKNI